MTDLKKSIDLNNEAVFLLQYEKPREAVEVLKTALRQLKEDYRKPRHQSTLAIETDCMMVSKIPTPSISGVALEDSSSSLAESLLPEDLGSFSSLCSEHDPMIEDDEGKDKLSIKSVPVLTDMLTEVHDLCDHSSVLIFDRALSIESDVITYECAAGCIMFNLALCHHVRGVTRGKNDYLVRALNLYKMSLQVALKLDAAIATHSLLLMALFNNMAHINSNLFHLDKIRRCIRHLRVILAEQDITTIAEDEYVFFFTNVMFHEGIAFSIAPAA